MEGKQIINEIEARRIKIDGAGNLYTVAAGTTAKTSESVDTQDSETVCFELAVGAIVGGGTLDIKVQGSNDDGSTDAYVDLAGTGQTGIVLANSVVRAEVYRSAKRYLRLVCTRNTANITLDALLAKRAGLRVLPSKVQATETREITYSPDPGAA